MISERLINCPPQLASPLQHALFDEEIPWATEDEPSEELRNSFKFERFLFVSRVYQDNLEAPKPSGPGDRKGKKKKVPSTQHQHEWSTRFFEQLDVSAALHVFARPCNCLPSDCLECL